MCIVKHNYILGSMFTNTKHNYMFRQSMLAIFRLYMRKLINKLYRYVWGVYRLWSAVGARSLLCRRGRGLGMFRDHVKVTSMDVKVKVTSMDVTLT